VEEQRLYWIDSSAAEIWSCREDGSDVKLYFVPTHIGSMALREKGGAVLALANGFSLYDFRTQKLTHICDPEADEPENRLNDGKVDRRGRFIAGYMAYDHDREDASRGQRPVRNSTLYRLDPDLSVHRLDSGIKCSNGPCWSPDDRTFYFCDSYDKVMYAYDYDIATGGVSNRRVFASTKDYPGTFDGSTVDAEGYISMLGRWSERIVSEGKIIFPRSLEEALLRHPSVRYACVIGKPDPVKGEIVKGIVELYADKPATPEDLLSHCRNQLGPASPALIEIIPEMPMTPTGKIGRADLQKREREA
jgi:sugar lactone lactonase YvrE